MTDQERTGRGVPHRLPGVDLGAVPAEEPAALEYEPSRSAGSLEVVDGVFWWRQRVDQNWLAYYRLIPQAGGPVVAEVRLFPYEAGALGGEWSGSRGQDPVVPPGGLPARVLRAVNAGTPVSALTRRQRADLLRAEPPGTLTFGLWGRLGFTKEDLLQERPRGRAPIPDAFLVRFAAVYAEIVAAGGDRAHKPVVYAAADLGYSAVYVRDLVRLARKRGLLTPTPKGRAGGTLTPYAIRLLEETHADQKESPS